jgi:hemoglobin
MPISPKPSSTQLLPPATNNGALLMSIPTDKAQEHYSKLRARAEALGIDEEYIDRLLDTFYARVRTHEVLAPIFDEAIGDDWDEHPVIIRAFWVTFIFGGDGYTRDMGAIHKKLTNVRPEHFAIWLKLFRSALNDTAPCPEAVEYLIGRGQRVAKGLQTIMYGRSSRTLP